MIIEDIDLGALNAHGKCWSIQYRDKDGRIMYLRTSVIPYGKPIEALEDWFDEIIDTCKSIRELEEEILTLYEYADKIGRIVTIERLSNQNGRFIAYFKAAEIKSCNMLLTEVGNGKTPKEAVNDYSHNISGKTLVFNATSSTICPILKEV